MRGANRLGLGVVEHFAGSIDVLAEIAPMCTPPNRGVSCRWG
jgi:hypothetical protein